MLVATTTTRTRNTEKRGREPTSLSSNLNYDDRTSHGTQMNLESISNPVRLQLSTGLYPKRVSSPGLGLVVKSVLCPIGKGPAVYSNADTTSPTSLHKYHYQKERIEEFINSISRWRRGWKETKKPGKQKCKSILRTKIQSGGFSAPLSTSFVHPIPQHQIRDRQASSCGICCRVPVKTIADKVSPCDF